MFVGALFIFLGRTVNFAAMTTAQEAAGNDDNASQSADEKNDDSECFQR